VLLQNLTFQSRPIWFNRYCQISRSSLRHLPRPWKPWSRTTWLIAGPAASPPTRSTRPTVIRLGESCCPSSFYLGNLGLFAPVPGADHANVFSLNDRGDLNLLKSGLTAVTGVAVHDGTVYALEAFTGFFAPEPSAAKTGTIVRLNRRSGNWDPVVTGLNFPTAMTFGPDGNLYVSNKGFG
jgi:hypothetical protein